MNTVEDALVIDPASHASPNFAIDIPPILTVEVAPVIGST